MQYLSYFEAGTVVLASLLTLFNYFISLRLKGIEERIKRLEEFERYSKKNFELIFKISGQIDTIIKRLNDKF